MVGKKIFINYRRFDEWGFAHALYSNLGYRFALRELFMDEHIGPGQNFVEVIKKEIATSYAVLVVIGPRWSELLRRSDPTDFLVFEIWMALDQLKLVIPVLVNGASMPHQDSLPETIRPLAYRQAAILRPERFKADCRDLAARLKDIKKSGSVGSLLGATLLTSG